MIEYNNNIIKILYHIMWDGYLFLERICLGAFDNVYDNFISLD